MEKKIKFTEMDTFSQQCYEQLEHEIVDGDLKPGSKLKVMQLKERFGIGQSPVREALSRLVASGLVSVEENKGFRVARMSEKDIRDIYRVFTAVEIMALEWAIEEGDDLWRSQIVAALYQLSLIENSTDQLDSYQVWAEKNYNFHFALIAGCNSPQLLEIRRNLYLKFDRYCRLSYQLAQRPLSVNYKEHEQLAEAVLQRDTKKAVAIMNHHINGPLEDIIEVLKKNGLLGEIS